MNRICWGVLVACLYLGPLTAQAEAPPGIYQRTVQAPVEPVYRAVYKALEEARFWVVFEADILANNARFEQRWGEDFNPSKLSAIRAMVVCNGWFANQVTGADPALAALCPLRVGLTEKNGVTQVSFARPTLAAEGSPGYGVVAKVEGLMIEAIDRGVAAVETAP